MKCSNSKWRNSANRAPGRARQLALTIVEMMVAIALLAVIIVGLCAAFQQVVRTLHAASNQSATFDNARAAVQLISRDLSEMVQVGRGGDLAGGFLLGSMTNSATPLPLASTNLTLFFSHAFWLTHVNDDWHAIGYHWDGDTNFGVGTLYRTYETTTHLGSVDRWLRNVSTSSVPVHRMSDGIVHFHMEAVSYYPQSYVWWITKTNWARDDRGAFNVRQFPAFVDFELGVLEPATLKQFRALTNNTEVAQKFLREHAGSIHFFRERVPIRNFINPYRENEVL